ncbi:hypothetical protein BYT27DRAFT_7190629 [Phlegmacium glaucopus]|nr:hypothetical protein BYT27DRAFT_7190629 [Phlegmacium glaucopus]
MSICVALGIMFGRGIQSLYVGIKKKRETKRQKKREQQRLSEQPHESAYFQPSGRGEYQHLSDQGEEILGGSDHDHTQHHFRRDGENNPRTHPQLHRTVAPSPLQTLDWMDTPVDPLEDTLPTYDHGAAQLPPYDHTLPNSTGRITSRRGRRRQREGRQAYEPLDGIGRRINNEPQLRARACTGIRIREHPGLDVDHDQGAGGGIIWYDALEDRYEVISRSLAPPTEPPLPPPYMPNSCIMYG